eukprot:9487145-Pyramimonas_sp.AAC.1
MVEFHNEMAKESDIFAKDMLEPHAAGLATMCADMLQCYAKDFVEVWQKTVLLETFEPKTAADFMVDGVDSWTQLVNAGNDISILAKSFHCFNVSAETVVDAFAGVVNLMKVVQEYLIFK